MSAAALRTIWPELGDRRRLLGTPELSFFAFMESSFRFR
jgi:hypothetical protein